MIRRIPRFLAALSILAGIYGVQAQENVATHWNADPAADIFKIGKFDGPADLKTPNGWQDLSAFGSGNAKLEPTGAGILRLTLQPGDTKAHIETLIDVPQGAKYLTFMVRLRGPTLERTSEPNSGAGVRFSLVKDDQERSLKRFEPNYDGYRNWSFPMQTMQVMPGENRLRIRAEVTNVTGALEIESILVVPSNTSNEATKEQAEQLEQAIRSDDPELMRRLVEADPNMLEVRTGGYDNGTPLTRTAWVGASKVAAMLIKMGANLEAKDTNWGNTPLRWCCWWGEPEVAQVLLEAGADARGASGMARSSKTNNPFTKKKPEDFDRTIEVIEAYLAKKQAQK